MVDSVPYRIWSLWNASVKHFIPMWFRPDSVQCQPSLVSVAARHCFLSDHCGVSYCIEWKGIDNFCAECTTVCAVVSYRCAIIGEISCSYTARWLHKDLPLLDWYHIFLHWFHIDLPLSVRYHIYIYIGFIKICHHWTDIIFI